MLLQELSKTSPYAGLLADAPQAIITAYRKDCKIPEYAQIDMSIAMENMWLATDEIGLGGVWMRLAFLHWDIRQKKRSRKTGTIRKGYIFFKNNE